VYPSSQRGIQNVLYHLLIRRAYDASFNWVGYSPTASRRGEIDIPCSELSATDRPGNFCRSMCAGFIDSFELLLTSTK
jgi:hypothetical protein